MAALGGAGAGGGGGGGGGIPAAPGGNGGGNCGGGSDDTDMLPLCPPLVPSPSADPPAAAVVAAGGAGGGEGGGAAVGAGGDAAGTAPAAPVEVELGCRGTTCGNFTRASSCSITALLRRIPELLGCSSARPHMAANDSVRLSRGSTSCGHVWAHSSSRRAERPKATPSPSDTRICRDLAAVTSAERDRWLEPTAAVLFHSFPCAAAVAPLPLPLPQLLLLLLLLL